MRPNIKDIAERTGVSKTRDAECAEHLAVVIKHPACSISLRGAVRQPDALPAARVWNGCQGGFAIAGKAFAWSSASFQQRGWGNWGITLRVFTIVRNKLLLYNELVMQ